MKKHAVIANFNCTFGEDNKPMLTYFKEIIYPAFINNHYREIGDDKYFFENIRIETLNSGRMILSGFLVKSTKLEVKSEIIDGKVEFTDKKYQSAPISIFTMFLDNHRIIYTLNQKGSPNIASFGATIKSFIKKEVRKYNIGRPKEERLTNININVVDIPTQNGIQANMENVKKINLLTFDFFNPNGDLPLDDSYKWVFNELEELKSKRGKISYTSPGNFEKVSERIESSKGFAEVKMNVNFKNGASGKLDNKSLTEKFEIDVPEGTGIQTIEEIAYSTLVQNPLIAEVGVENKEIFNSNKQKIIESISNIN